MFSFCCGVLEEGEFDKEEERISKLYENGELYIEAEERNTYSRNKDVVIENGSYSIKAGINGDELPSAVFPATAGYSNKGMNVGMKNRRNDLYKMSNERIRRMKNLNYPIKYGTITKWSEVESLWQDTFTRLSFGQYYRHVLLTEPPLNPKNIREKMTSTMFESFNASSLYIGISEVFALYGSGRMTGSVLSIGDQVTHSVPVYEGSAIPHAVEVMKLGGRDITTNLQRMLFMESEGEEEVVIDIKEKTSYIALDCESESRKAENTSDCDYEYELPDGTTIMLGKERFQAPEILFKPEKRKGMSKRGIHNLTYNTIKKCDVDIRNEMYKNIVICGGSTMIEGIQERLTAEVMKLSGHYSSVNVHAHPERNFLVWKGGSIFSSLSTYENARISKREYNDCGATIVHRKCF